MEQNVQQEALTKVINQLKNQSQHPKQLVFSKEQAKKIFQQLKKAKEESKKINDEGIK